jgi:hypothetical protein
MKVAMLSWFQKNKPELVESKWEKMFRAEGWILIKGPPYCPWANESELPWRDGKNSSAREHMSRQGIHAAANNMMDWMFGTDSSTKRKKQQPRYGPEQAAVHRRQVAEEITSWVERYGVRLSGEYPNMEYDATKMYKDDGSIKLAEDGLLYDSDSDDDCGEAYDSE